MSNEKSEIINELIKLYSLIKLYCLNKVKNNSKANKTIDYILISRQISELEEKLTDQPIKGSGMFTSQNKFVKLLI